MKQMKVVMVGAGNRCNIYASYSLLEPELMKVVGIVDPDPVRTELMREKFDVPVENCFSSLVISFSLWKAKSLKVQVQDVWQIVRTLKLVHIQHTLPIFCSLNVGTSMCGNV